MKVTQIVNYTNKAYANTKLIRKYVENEPNC